MGILGGLLVIGGFVTVILLVVYFTTKVTGPKENEEIQRLKKRLDDPRIYDPETDTYITLGEAESGVWDVDDPSKKINSKDVEETLYEEEIIIRNICKELEKEGFEKAKSPLSEAQFKTFERLQLLSQLDEEWGYVKFYERDGLVATVLNIHHAPEFAISIPIQKVTGHYIFKEKTISDRFFDVIRPDDDIQIKNYECYSVKTTKLKRAVENIMNVINDYKDLEIEILPGQLFIKTTRTAQLADALILLELAKKCLKKFN